MPPKSKVQAAKVEKPAEKPTEKKAEQAPEKSHDKDKLEEVRPLLEALARAVRRREASDGEGEDYTTTKAPLEFQGVTDGWGEVPRALRATFRFERTLIYGAAGVPVIGTKEFAAFIAEATRAGVLPASMAALAPRLDLIFSHPLLRPAGVAMQEIAAAAVALDGAASPRTFPLVLDAFDRSNTVARCILMELAALYIVKRTAVRVSGSVRPYGEILGMLFADREFLVTVGADRVPAAVSLVSLLLGSVEDESFTVSNDFARRMQRGRGRGQAFQPYRGQGRGAGRGGGYYGQPQGQQQFQQGQQQFQQGQQQFQQGQGQQREFHAGAPITSYKAGASN